MKASASERLRVGDLSRRTGKSVRALHLYEELDLLHPVGRTSGGFRLYDERALTRIRWIELLQESGFSLHQIQALLRTWQGTRYGTDAMKVLRETFRKRLEETRQTIQRFQDLARELEESLQYLSTCQLCQPPRTTREDCPHCPVDHRMKTEPTLVAGFQTAPRSSGAIQLPVLSEDR